MSNWLEVDRGGLPTLDVDTPRLGVKAKRLEGALLAEAFGLINELVAAIISSAWVSFGIFVCSTDQYISSFWQPMVSLLCITLPSASSTACDVKFSEGMRLMECFCRFFSFSMISKTAGSASRRCADNNFWPESV